MKNLYAIIMAGGKGERFWPLSTSATPKQTLSLFTGQPLMVEAVKRLSGLIPPERVLIITSKDLVAVTRKVVPFIPKANIVGEPMGRDTAAACALGTAIAKSRCNDAVCAILTADHIIAPKKVFLNTLRECAQKAKQEKFILTIGIPPTRPDTGFGYIQTGAKLETRKGIQFIKALKFVEKPSLPKAKRYLAGGKHYWNSGMFIWSADTFFNSLKAFAPQLYKMAIKVAACASSNAVMKVINAEYPKLNRISVDYAVMEKSDNITMAVAKFKWDDVGSWIAIENHFNKDASKNTLHGQALQLNSKSNIVVSEKRLTALIGVRDLVVVQADDATLICARDDVQKVKDFVKIISADPSYKKLT